MQILNRFRQSFQEKNEAVNNDAYAEDEPLTPEEEDQLDDVLEEMEQGIAKERLPDAKLIAHCGTNRVTRLDLAQLPTPDATATFQPIPHTRLIDQLEEALAFRHIRITRDEYAVSPDGMKLFALLEVNSDFEGVRFAIGLRNANDKSMRLGMVAGYRVFCCDNMSLSGDFKPLLAKHSKNFDLIESLALGVDRIQRNWQPLRDRIDFMRNYNLDSNEARMIIYTAFMSNKFPLKLMKSVHKEYFEAPSYEEFKQPTMFSLENAFTTNFKQLKPVQQYQATARLGKFLASYSKN